MKTKQGLMIEVRELMKDLTDNGALLQRNKHNIVRTGALLHCRTEILKSIVYRQGLIIEYMSNEAEYWEVA